MTHVNEVEYESGYNVDPDVVSVGAAAHAGASVGSAPVGINRALGISPCRRRMPLSLCFVQGKNQYLSPVLWLLPQENQQQPQPKLRIDLPHWKEQILQESPLL